MKAVAFGGRDFLLQRICDKALDKISERMPITVLICGKARGLDTLAFNWAKAKGIKIEEYIPDWNNLGKVAGILRNVDMYRKGNPHFGVAFPGGNGTNHMFELLKNNKVLIYKVQLEKGKWVIRTING